MLVPACFGDRLGVSLAAPREVSKRMVFIMASSCILKAWHFGSHLSWYPFRFLQGTSPRLHVFAAFPGPFGGGGFISNRPKTLSVAENSMTSSERPSPEPLPKKEVSPAVLRGSEFWRSSGGFKCLE